MWGIDDGEKVMYIIRTEESESGSIYCLHLRSNIKQHTTNVTSPHAAGILYDNISFSWLVFSIAKKTLKLICWAQIHNVDTYVVNAQMLCICFMVWRTPYVFCSNECAINIDTFSNNQSLKRRADGTNWASHNFRQFRFICICTQDSWQFLFIFK